MELVVGELVRDAVGKRVSTPAALVTLEAISVGANKAKKMYAAKQTMAFQFDKN